MSEADRSPELDEIQADDRPGSLSTVQLIDRTEQLGLVARNRGDSDDRRLVRLTLTEAGQEKLARLSAIPVEALRRLATLVNALISSAVTA